MGGSAVMQGGGLGHLEMKGGCKSGGGRGMGLGEGWGEGLGQEGRTDFQLHARCSFLRSSSSLVCVCVWCVCVCDCVSVSA
jgi:hypothetical protein